MSTESDFEFVMINVLGQKKDSPLSIAFANGGITDVYGIVALNSLSIAKLRYKDPTFKPPIDEKLNVGLQNLIRVFNAFVETKIDDGDPIHKDWPNKFIKSEFDNFRMAGFAKYVGIHQSSVPVPVAPKALAGGTYAAKARDPVLEFKMGVNCDPVSFTVMKDNKQDGIVETSSEPPGLGSIPSEPRLPTSIAIDLNDEEGIFETPSEPPGLGPIPNDPRLSTSIVIDFDDDDGIFETPSKPPGLGSCLSTSIDDAVIGLDDGLFTSDPLDGEKLTKFKCLLGEDEFEGIKEILDGDGIFETASEPPAGLGPISNEPRLSTSIVIDLDDDDGTFETPSEPPGLGSTSIVIALDYGDGIDETSSEPIVTDPDDADGIAAIPSEPPGLGSGLSTSIVIDDDGIFKIGRAHV